jgi:putative hemolysin
MNCQVITSLSYVSNHKVQVGVVVYLAVWLITQLTGYVTSTSSMANPDSEVCLAEGYTMWHFTVRLDVTCASGFATD